MIRSRHMGKLATTLVRSQHVGRIPAKYQHIIVRCLGYKHDDIVPGVRSEYGSLGDMPSGPTQPASWQAEHNQDIQNVTQKALIYELTQQQTRTIEDVVPWFLANMPPAYFRQIPENFRVAHVKAISAVKDADMELHLNLQANMPDGRRVITFIRPGTAPGTLLKMIMELPFADNDGSDYMPLTRLHVFSSEDEKMSLNMFVYGNREGAPSEVTADLVTPVLEYADLVQGGQLGTKTTDGLLHPVASPLFDKENLMQYLRKCSHNYMYGIDDWYSFLYGDYCTAHIFLSAPTQQLWSFESSSFSATNGNV